MRPKSASKKNTKKATALLKQKASQKSKPISKSSKIKRKTSARTKADKEPILEGSW
ncbi:MAG: hypothetical protein GW938_00195, partial [Leptospira sp.]|nr:hypothetical protein [Leptospira sp.]